MLTLAGSAAAASDVPAAITGHHCSVRNGELLVESVWHRGSGDSAAMAPDVQPVLARALPDGAQLERTGERPTRWRLRVPLDQIEDALPLPLPPGDGWHRVHVERSLGFVPAPSLGLVLQVGYQATPDIERADRRIIDAALGRPTPRGALYLSSDSLDTAGGFAGEITTRAALKRRAMWVAALLFVLTSAGMLLGYRRLSRRAELEQAEAVLRARFAELQEQDDVQAL